MKNLIACALNILIHPTFFKISGVLMTAYMIRFTSYIDVGKLPPLGTNELLDSEKTYTNLQGVAGRRFFLFIQLEKQIERYSPKINRKIFEEIVENPTKMKK